VAIPDDCSQIEESVFTEMLKMVKGKKVITRPQATLLSPVKQYIAITHSPRCLCISLVKNGIITMQEFIAVDVVGQDKIQVALRLKRAVEVFDKGDNLPLFCYDVPEVYKLGEVVTTNEVLRNSVNYFAF
jgi:hypothetical protein